MSPRWCPLFHFALLAAAFVGACDDGGGDAGPRICRGTVEAGSLVVFEQCEEGTQCQGGLCNLGYCPEPCVDDSDCMNFGGGVSCDAAVGYCRILCQDAQDCPQFPGNPMICVESRHCSAPSSPCG